MEKRAVITGMGAVTPIGLGKDENWENLLNQQSGIGPFSRIDPEHLPVGVGAEVKNFNPRDFIKDRKTIRLTFHNVHLAIAAAKLAVEDAGLETEKVDPARFGAIIGSGGGGFDDGPGFEDLNDPILKSWDEENQRFDSARFGKEGVPSAYPLFLLKALPNNAFYYISLMYNIQGENDNIVSSYTGGAQAIGDSFRAIRRGLADVIIAGGYDSLITPNTIFSLDSFNLLSRETAPEKTCRPFDSNRNGMVAGEGAGFLVIEELEYARKRGAKIYAEIVGYGNASSAYHMYMPAPDGSGLIRSANRAIQDAEIDPGRIDWVCADGIGTRDSDAAEAKALHEILGQHISDIPVTGTKSVTGHMGSGTGPAESIYAVMALENGIIPPTANCQNPDPALSLNLVTGSPLNKELHTVLNLNQGIGGQCTALIFQKI